MGKENVPSSQSFLEKVLDLATVPLGWRLGHAISSSPGRRLWALPLSLPRESLAILRIQSQNLDQRLLRIGPLL